MAKGCPFFATSTPICDGGGGGRAGKSLGDSLAHSQFNTIINLSSKVRDKCT